MSFSNGSNPLSAENRILDGCHRPWISVAAIQITISMGAIAFGSPWLIQIVFRCALPDIVHQNLTFTCSSFACVGVTKKYRCLDMGDDIPLFVIRASRTSRTLMLWIRTRKLPPVQTPDYKRVKTTVPPQPLPPPPSPPQPPAIVAGTGQPRPTRFAKRVPKPTLLEKALGSVQY